jgi:hypothetical protein
MLVSALDWIAPRTLGVLTVDGFGAEDPPPPHADRHATAKRIIIFRIALIAVPSLCPAV